MEKTLGIHRDWVQPTYDSETLSSAGSRKRGAARSPARTGRAVLFTTCSVELQRRRRRRAPRSRCWSTAASRSTLCYERCCGMPFTDGGRPRQRARRTPSATSPTCCRTSTPARRRRARPVLLAACSRTSTRSCSGRDAARARRRRDARPDGVPLRARRATKKLDARLPRSRSAGSPITRPATCAHQNIGFRARELLRLAGADVDADRRLLRRRRHLGHAGALPRRVAEGRGEAAAAHRSGARPTTSPPTARSPRCASRRARGRKAVHPIVLLRHAYGERRDEAAALSEIVPASSAYERTARRLPRARDRAQAHAPGRASATASTLLFEDRETLRFQVQEMLRVERIARARAQIQARARRLQRADAAATASSRRRCSSRSPSPPRSAPSSIG